MRPDLAGRLTEAGAYAGGYWTAEREQAVWEGVLRKQARETRGIGVVAAVTVVLAAIFVSWFALRPWTGGSSVASGQVGDPGLLMQLADGSTVTAVGVGVRIEPVRVTAADVVVRLRSGSARYSVTPSPSRAFRVLVHDYSVTVLGTVFTVTLGTSSMEVTVERGIVSVAGPGIERRLERGTSATFPLHAETRSTARSEAVLDSVSAPEQPAAVDAAPQQPTPESSVEAAPRGSAPSWRDLAHRGEYSKSYELLQRQGKTAVRDDVGELLLVADVARLSGHPSAAEPALRQVLRKHARDSRAPLAAFTLGRVLLDELERPVEAAETFAAARRLAPSGPLVQDALAREVECWARAGQADRAKSLAQTYLEVYPNSPRAKAVKHYGGIE
ncbi:MAG: tetratricopeptide repeat protein [Polyangiaceae bacterium]|nr:tetratricopeptide repeat protein [Polyangiaceae bacterium]